jgi:hypothetical protein
VPFHGYGAEHIVGREDQSLNSQLFRVDQGMLTEILKTYQRPGEPKRRWFYSPDQDLSVWLDEQGEIVAFQLCYSKHRNEHALYWRADFGYSHLKVDDGEGTTLSSDAPILLADGFFDHEAALKRFVSLGGSLPEDVFCFVSSRISEYNKN